MKKTAHAFIPHRNGTGFTLIELLVVVAIIAILSSVVVASLGTSRQKSRDAVRVANIKQLQNALELYRNANGSYPTILAELAPTYIPSVPVDPQDGGSGDPTCRSGSYCYGIGADFGYHLGANLERIDSQVLKSDADFASINDPSLVSGGFNGTIEDQNSGFISYDVRP